MGYYQAPFDNFRQGLREDPLREDCRHVHFVVVGGGIAGVSCAEQLALECPSKDILLISASPVVKAATNVKKFARTLEEFDVEEKSYGAIESEYPNIKVIYAAVERLDSESHEIHLSTKQTFVYEKLCLCAGAVPKLITKNSPHVLGLRDTETVQVFKQRLAGAKRVMIIGNGGIATELAHKITNCQVIWAVKDKSFGATFFDAGAAEFFSPCLNNSQSESSTISKRTKYTLEEWKKISSSCLGSALGPDWSNGLPLEGQRNKTRDVHLQFCCEVEHILTAEEFSKSSLCETSLNGTVLKDYWPIYVKLTNNSVFGCDFLVSATGVEPNTRPFLKGNKFEIAADGGIKVNDQMQTSVKDVYAAGDICTASWQHSEHWFQMRLWTQAKQMGAYAGQCIAAHERGETKALDICFDIFTHVTRFFGYKVILLGLYNCQKLGSDCELLLRITRGQEYVKVVLQNGRMKGAILIGDTDLEETFENLILNQLDLTCYGEDLLDPDVDIEDYFD